MTENESRFLAEIGNRIRVDGIVEVHLFAPIRQGGAETGVAVVACSPAELDVVEAAAPASAAAVDGPLEEVEAGSQPDAGEPDAEVGGAVSEPAAAPPAMEEPAAALQVSAESAERADDRLTIYTASYRHTFKGPERGKWEFDIVVEADAPLLTVDRVVSGVIQRSGEQGEPVRLTAADIRAEIGDLNCTATKP